MWFILLLPYRRFRMTEFAKHCIEISTTPLVLALLVAVVGTAFRIFGRRRIAGWLWVSAATITYFSATGIVGDALLGPLEREYPPLQDGSLPAVDYIVVMGSGYVPRDGIPVTAALDEDGVIRIVEGVRLLRLVGHLHPVRLVVSGGAPPGRVPPAFGYAKLARGLGVPGTSIIVLSHSLDTSDEAHSVAGKLGAKSFILVTSAYHMPRAMRLMERAGAHPYPAPTGQRAIEAPLSDLGSLLPTSGGLRKTELAVHEYLGLGALALGIDR